MVKRINDTKPFVDSTNVLFNNDKFNRKMERTYQVH